MPGLLSRFSSWTWCLRTSIFNEYLYASSTLQSVEESLRQAGRVDDLSRLNLKAGDVVVDIGCNDGILLNGYALPGLVRVGVEPSQLSETARKSGLHVIRSFFNKASASEIVRQYGTAKVVTATNVFAHVDEIGKFVENLPALIGTDGVFVVESPYLIDMIDQILFDTIYHEHLCYLSLTPMVPFLGRYGLEVFDIERIPFGASGPASRVFIEISTLSRCRPPRWQTCSRWKRNGESKNLSISKQKMPKSGKHQI